MSRLPPEPRPPPEEPNPLRGCCPVHGTRLHRTRTGGNGPFACVRFEVVCAECLQEAQAAFFRRQKVRLCLIVTGLVLVVNLLLSGLDAWLIGAGWGTATAVASAAVVALLCLPLSVYMAEGEA